MGILDAPALTRSQGDLRYLKGLLVNPNGLRRARALRGQALRSRFDVVVLGNSIPAGQGSSGINQYQPAGPTYSWLQSDNYNGWTGQLRSLLNTQLGVDPGEGFVYGNDPRVTLGSGSVSYQFAGPLRNSVQIPTGSTVTLAVPASGAGVPQCTYVGIVFWDQAGNSLPTVTVGGTAATMFTTPGGATAQTSTASGAFKVGYVAAANGASVVVTGGGGQTYVPGFDLVGSPFGVHVHRMCQPGYITADLLGGANGGTLAATTGTGGQMDRVVRSSYQWLNPGLMILANWDVNDSGGQNATRTVTATTTSGSPALTITSGALDITDIAKPVSGTGIPGGATLAAVSTSTAAAMSVNATASGSITMTVTTVPALSGMTPTLSAQYLDRFLNNTGGTASTGALGLGWSALLVGGPRSVNDGSTPAPPYSQSAYIAAQAGIINTADANLQHVAALDLSRVWGSGAAARASDLALQLANTVHPSLRGHGDIARIVGEVVNTVTTLGAVTTAVPA